MPVILLCLTFLAAGAAAHATKRVAVPHDRAVRAATAQTSVMFQQVADVAEPALAYDVLFMGEYRRELRRGVLFAEGDVLWVRVPPDYDIKALDRVARLLARRGGSSIRLSLDRLTETDLYSELRRRVGGRRVVVIDGLARLRGPHGGEEMRLVDQLELVVHDWRRQGRLVILVDRDRYFDEAPEALKRLPTAFPDGFEALDVSTCNDRLWRQ